MRYVPVASRKRRSPQVLVHRESLEGKLGRPIRPGMGALHHCDTNACHEPEHLYEGTNTDNMQDMLSRGRGRWKTVPLPEIKQAEIFRRYLAGGILQRELAAEYGVGQKAVSQIIRQRAKAAQQEDIAQLDERRSEWRSRIGRPKSLFIEPGQRFGRLTVVREAEPQPGPRRPRRAELTCDCGTMTTQNLSDLFRGVVQSCGCYNRELITKPTPEHGTRAMYRRHRAAGETPCAACRKAEADYTRERRNAAARAAA